MVPNASARLDLNARTAGQFVDCFRIDRFAGARTVQIHHMQSSHARRPVSVRQRLWILGIGGDLLKITFVQTDTLAPE